MGFQIKHGMASTRIYKIWKGMKDRCYNKNRKHYMRYGGMGIKVCNRWLNSFEAFYEDMGERPVGMSIDRIDGSKDYSPDNCKWSSPQEQANNMITNVIIKCNDMSMTLPQWARTLKINPKTLRWRLDNGWSIEKSLFRPVRGHG